MAYDKLNSFILNYLKNDLTGRAIMLTGKWGSGKSYYVKNTLKPFLEDEDNGKHKCVIVSLYGLSDISEISQAIYTELRTIKKETDTEIGNTTKVVGKIVCKTIFNGLVSKIGFDIGKINESDLQKVYESVDLTNKLIVFEDIERTQIDIIELLGYINNMCENDGVKVLLVTNEDEIFPTYEHTDEQEKTVKLNTEKAVVYKKSKEKTVGDTVYFICDYESTIQQIINTFGIFLQKYSSSENAADIWNIFILTNSYNLRAFIYGCQKSKDIFEFIERENIQISDEIEKIIFYGIIAFTQTQSKGTNLQFDEDTYISAKLGLNEQYPLFRFCYDYIVYQILSKEEIKKSSTYYNKYRMNGKWNSGRDNDLRIIKEFSKRTEKEVINAIQNLPFKLNAGDIPYYDYGVLMNYLVAIKFEAEIDFHIEPIESCILEYLKKAPDEIKIESLFNSGYELHKEEAINAFANIKQRMKDALEYKQLPLFEYQPKKIEEFCKKAKSITKKIYEEGFACKIDIQQFVDMLKKCSPKQLSDIREMFLEIYPEKTNFSNSPIVGRQIIQEVDTSEIVLDEDIHSLHLLEKEICKLMNYVDYDKIQKLQIKWFISDLNRMLEYLIK